MYWNWELAVEGTQWNQPGARLTLKIFVDSIKEDIEKYNLRDYFEKHKSSETTE